MKLPSGSQLGTARGKKQRINKLTICLYESAGGKYGPNSGDLIDIPYSVTPDTTLHTEDVPAQFDGDWLDEATITIVQDKPLPMTVLAIVPRLTLYEGED
jgi:hypothetical protein